MKTQIFCFLLVLFAVDFREFNIHKSKSVRVTDVLQGGKDLTVKTSMPLDLTSVSKIKMVVAEIGQNNRIKILRNIII